MKQTQIAMNDTDIITFTSARNLLNMHECKSSRSRKSNLPSRKRADSTISWIFALPKTSNRPHILTRISLSYCDADIVVTRSNVMESCRCKRFVYISTVKRMTFNVKFPSRITFVFLQIRTRDNIMV